VSAERLPFNESFLREKLKNDPTAWETRRELAHGLYNKQAYAEAAEIIWNADQIPSTDLDLAFAIRILAKAQPRRAIRLLTAVLELNAGKAVQNMAMANALLHHGMVLQAARFYGAALDADPSLANSDLEHFILWSDDECTMWGLFEKHRPKLGELPWMIRDPKEALRLTSRVSLHTTPIYVPDLPTVAGEKIKHELYQQEPAHNAKITPPPAVTIPIDRVDPKDRLFDATYGASVVNSAPAKVVAPLEPAAATTPTPIPTPIPIPDAVILEPVIAPQSIAAFFADPTPSSSVQEAEVTSFFADPTPSSQIKLPSIQLENTEESNPAAVQSVTEKKNTPVPAAIPIRSSSVPTTPLQEKWSTAPAGPDADFAPVTAPVPAPRPFVQPVSAVSPAAPQSPPMAPAPFVPADPHQASATIVSPTPKRALLPSGTPPVNPTGTPTRALLPSGAPPANPTGTPTRVLLPSGAPPENAGAPRRLLLTPSRPTPPPENQ
jgi:hypothetical protein